MKDLLKLSWFTPKVALIFLVVFYLFLFITNGEPYVRSDGYYYFHTAECIINEHNFVCSKKPVYWDFMDMHTKSILDGKYVSVVAPGTSLLNLPALIVGKALSHMININNDYFLNYNGHTLIEGIMLLLNSILFSLLSIILIYKSLRILKFSARNSIISIGVVLISSFALWYVFLLPIFTHTYEIFTMSLLLYSLINFQKKQRKKYLILSGIAIGIAVLIRPIFVPVGVATLIYLFMNLPKDLKIIKKIKMLSYFLITGMPFAIIYILYNYISYGTLITSGYDSIRGESFSTTFNGLNILFSVYRGWFIYSPILLISLIGLIILIKKYKTLALFCLFSIFSGVVIYGFWPNWWGGGSYGSRFMLFALPFLAIGLAEILAHVNQIAKVRKRIISTIIILFFIYSSLLFVLYRVVPVGFDFYTPLHFLKAELSYIKSAQSLKELANVNLEHIQGGSGLLAVLTGISNPVLKVNSNGANKFSWSIYTPPKLSRPLPNSIQFLIVNSKTHKAFQGELKNIAKNDVLEIICDDRCSSNDSKMVISETSQTPNTLVVGEYIGIKLNSNISIYFKQTKNIQYRGEMLMWIPEEGLYHL